MHVRNSGLALAATLLVAACAERLPLAPDAARGPDAAPLASIGAVGACAAPTVQWDGASVDARGRRVITGTTGADVIAGTSGDDVINALDGDDVVCAGDGNDVVFGGRGANQLFGEGGDDQLGGDSQAGVNHFSGGAGIDRLSIKSPGGQVVVNLGGAAAWDHDRDAATPSVAARTVRGGHYDGSTIASTVAIIEGRSRTVADVEQVTNDSPNSPIAIMGDLQANLLVGGNRADVFEGHDGNDRIFAGDGDDDARGGSGDDLIVMGAGDDRANAGDGSDVAWGEGGDDFFDGSVGDDLFFGGDGRDRIIGYTGTDTMHYNPGEDDDRSESQSEVRVTPDRSSTLGGNALRAPRLP